MYHSLIDGAARVCAHVYALADVCANVRSCARACVRVLLSKWVRAQMLLQRARNSLDVAVGFLELIERRRFDSANAQVAPAPAAKAPSLRPPF